MPTEIQWSARRSLVHASARGRDLRGVVPPPVRGWNSRDPLAAMDPTFGVELVNWFPDLGKVTTRRGWKQHADTGSSDAVDTLHVHRFGSSERLFAFTSAGVWDVSTATAASQTIPTAVTNGRWRGATLNARTVLVNGVDEPLSVNSSGVWVAHGLSGTGLTTTDLIAVAAHHNRLWFLEKNTANLWYSGLNEVTGTLTRLPNAVGASRGGNCVALGSISRDTGIGPEDLLAVYMSSGDVIVYSGTDPATATTFRRVGSYELAPAAGPTPLVKMGGDLIAITSDGYIPLLQFLGAGREQRNLAISDAIAPTVTALVAGSRTAPGWQAVVHTPGNMLIVNHPVGTTFEQHVMNLQTGAWAHFTGIPAHCWVTWKDKLYFGASAGKVNQADTGETDNGTAITAEAATAFHYFGSPYDKQFRAIQPHIEGPSGSGSAISVGVVADFDQAPPQLESAQLSPDDGAVWDESEWDSGLWASGVSRTHRWRTVRQRGSALGVHVQAVTLAGPVSWFSTNVRYEALRGLTLS